MAASQIGMDTNSRIIDSLTHWNFVLAISAFLWHCKAKSASNSCSDAPSTFWVYCPASKLAMPPKYRRDARGPASLGKVAATRDPMLASRTSAEVAARMADTAPQPGAAGMSAASTPSQGTGVDEMRATLRQRLNETWGELGPEVVLVLGRPPTFHLGGQEFGAFENALVPRNPRATHPVAAAALPFAIQSIETAIGRVRRLVKHGATALPSVQRRTARRPTASRKIFIVHGHDRALLAEVTQFVGELHLEPVVLQEEPHGGRTLIEKFEQYSDASFAIILLTPDDLGRSAQDSGGVLHPRARQNVVLEWGFFMGALGRARVAVLYKGVERPSDIEGLAYVPADDPSWKLGLLKELQHAGFNVSL